MESILIIANITGPLAYQFTNTHAYTYQYLWFNALISVLQNCVKADIHLQDGLSVTGTK